MRNKIYLSILVFLFFANTSLAGSTQTNKPNEKTETTGLSRFFLDYAIVNSNLKNNEGYPMELLKLYEKNPRSANFIADFWHKKAFRNCEESINRIMDRHLNKITSDTTEEEKNKTTKAINDEAYQCFYGFYYDNWDKINKTIVDRLKAEKIPYKKNNYIWLLLFIIPLPLLIFIWIRYKKKTLLHSNSNSR